MNSLYQNLLRQTASLTEQLHRLELSPTLPPSHHAQIQASFSALENSLRDYIEFTKREPNLIKREKAQLRIKDFKLSIESLRERYKRTESKQQIVETQKAERIELLNTTSEVSIPINDPLLHFQREQKALQQTENSLDDFLEQTKSTLQNLVDQRHILKKAQRKMLDTANTLGLSKSLVNTIEKRGLQDYYLLWMLIVLSLIIMGSVYYYFRWH